FDDTDYYAREMGTNLRKVFLAFERLIDPGELAPIKLLTNAWEREYADSSGAGGPASSAEPRPLNLDPGYLGLGKLVLASTKDHAHRIYLGQGIFAEVTLHYVRGLGWQPLPWTFPDYRRPPALDFFTRCREYLYGLHQAQLRRESDSG
ncbi:MAG: DUF4416 family protein, partial [Planctomycetia bacterium]|nr:DUF4416 family protein [Planctomycetia bacterium]